MTDCQIPSQNLKTITNQQEYLNVQFSMHWYQEDINSLLELLLQPILPVRIQETISGADRENIRFEWQQKFFILNFECCSQSCWIEGQDAPSKQLLSRLYASLVV